MSIEIRLVNLSCVYMINEIPCKGLLFHEDIKTHVVKILVVLFYS